MYLIAVLSYNFVTPFKRNIWFYLKEVAHRIEI